MPLSTRKSAGNFSDLSTHESFYVKVGFTVEDETYYVSAAKLQDALYDTALNQLPYKEVICRLAKQK